MSNLQNLPSNWEHGGGEANRPLADDGYYTHRYVRHLRGSNQHLERYLELVVDTASMPPSEHVLLLTERRSDGWDSWDVAVEDTGSVTVDDPHDQHQQQEAEREAHELALEMMEKHSGD